MTLDEAINLLKQYIDYDNPNVPDFYTMAEACEVVIEALEQEPCDKTQMIDKSNFSMEQYRADLQSAYDCGKASVVPCGDAVSRQGVAEVLLKYAHSTEGKAFAEFLVSQINDLPSITPQPKMDSSSEKPDKWIPVSERLPNFAGVYLVTRYFPNNVMNPTYLVDACFFDGTDTWHNDNRINHDRKYLTNVVAWLEEPEPYKEIPTGSEGSDKE